MEAMFKQMLERLVDGIVILIVSGLIVGWSIDLQKKAAQQKRLGLISLLKVNQQLVGRTK